MCPNCKKISRCGCASCLERTKGKRGLIKPFKFVKGDFMKCPYCKVVNHCDAWLEEEYNQVIKDMQS